MDMILLATYDISDDKLRRNVETLLRDSGLQRVQYSVFRGKIPAKRLEKIKESCLKLLTDTEGKANVQIYPLLKKSLARAVQVTANSIENIEREISDKDIIVI